MNATNYYIKINHFLVTLREHQFNKLIFSQKKFVTKKDLFEAVADFFPPHFAIDHDWIRASGIARLTNQLMFPDHDQNRNKTRVSAVLDRA